MNLFEIVFMDNSTYSGKDYSNTGWLEIPDKKIRSLFYSLPSGDCLVLSNFKRIYHCVELPMDLNGQKKGIIRTEFANLFLERNNKIIHYRIDLRDGTIKVHTLNLDDHIVTQLNPIAWKK